MLLYVCVCVFSCVCACVCVSGALAENNIGAEGARALAEARRHNSTLQKLDLWGEPHFAPPYPLMRHYCCSLGSLGLCMRPGDCLTVPGLPLTAAGLALMRLSVCVCVGAPRRKQHRGRRGQGACGGAQAQLYTSEAGP